MSHELYVFGSLARGEVSPSSDVDILAIPGADNRRDFPRTWSVYSKETIESYFRAGRLFAWHLHLEAVRVYPLQGSSFLTGLGSPNSYTTARADIIELEALLEGALRELRCGTDSVIYELGIGYTAIRDIAMAASWRMLGKPSFSRNAPYLLPVNCPLPLKSFHTAMLARHASTRGTAEPQGLSEAVASFQHLPLLEWAASIRRSV